MTINAAEVGQNDYTGSGSTDTFDYEFKINDETELQVLQTDTTTMVVTEHVLTTDYTVTGVGDDGGGTVVLVAGNLAVGQDLTIKDNPVVEQDTPFGNQGPFYGKTHENAFDLLTRIVRRLSIGVVNTMQYFGLGNWDAESKTIEDVADPVNDQDAATKAWVLSNGATLFTEYASEILGSGVSAKTFDEADMGKFIVKEGNNILGITIAPQSTEVISDGASISIFNHTLSSGGYIQFVRGSGVELKVMNGYTAPLDYDPILRQGGSATLVHITGDDWVIFGDQGLQ